MFKKIVVAGLAVILIGGVLFFQGCGRKVKHYTLQQLLKVYTTYGASFSRDEKAIAFVTDATGVFNIWTVPVEGGEPKQLTFENENSIGGAWFSPNTDEIVYMQDVGGNELYHIYIMPASGGKAVDIIADPQVRAVFLGWSHDGNSFLYQTNSRDRRYMDVYSYDMKNRSSKMIFKNKKGLQFACASGDMNLIALVKTITSTDSDIYLYNVKKKRLANLTSHHGEIVFAPSTFSPDGKFLYYRTDEGSEFTYLKRMNLKNYQTEDVARDNWDIIYAGFSHNGRYFYYASNEDGSTKITVLNTVTDVPIELPNIPQGELSSIGFSRSEKFMTYYFRGDTRPRDLYLMGLKSGESSKLTNSVPEYLDTKDLVESKLVRYKSFDGLEIPAYLYTPHNIRKGEKLPALVWVHGGPGGQSRKGYDGLKQYFVNHGYVLLVVNNRGSSGYGKSFYTADDHKHGAEPLWDCVWGKKYLTTLPYVDSTRVGIIGGSYGGYMVLAALTFQPEVFAAGVDLFGIANWINVLNKIPPWWEAFRESLIKEIGSPKTEEAYLKSISPLFHADEITKPLLVLQGANDPRVPEEESEQIVEAVKSKGGVAKLIIFPDEGHGFRKLENRIKGYTAAKEFLDKYLKNKAG